MHFWGFGNADTVAVSWTCHKDWTAQLGNLQPGVCTTCCVSGATGALTEHCLTLTLLLHPCDVQVEGDDYCRPLPHSKVIYVCEDVDAASHVVQKCGVVDPITAALSSLAMTANHWQVLATECNANAAISDVPVTGGSPDSTKVGRKGSNNPLVAVH